MLTWGVSARKKSRLLKAAVRTSLIVLLTTLVFACVHALAKAAVADCEFNPYSLLEIPEGFVNPTALNVGSAAVFAFRGVGFDKDTSQKGKHS
eukprot:5380690-Amphidinium_carterae.1